jgi:hypothetical protein
MHPTSAYLTGKASINITGGRNHQEQHNNNRSLQYPKFNIGQTSRQKISKVKLDLITT